MHHHQRACLLSLAHHGHHVAELEHHDPAVSGEDLHRGRAQLRRALDACQCIGVGVLRDRGVEAEVDHCVPARLRDPALDSLRWVLARFRERELQKRRGAAERRGARG